MGENVKHTPGPWIPSKFGFQVLTGDSWNTICELRGGASWEDGRDGTLEANSRLIASAPDLLEALKECAAGSGFQYMMFEARERVNAAISKAEGRP